jgi:hypothetical protein
MLSSSEASRPFWRSKAECIAFLKSGFTKLSFVPIGATAVIALVVMIGWWELVSFRQPFDPVLAAIWVSMTALLSWRVRLRHDIILAFTALCGGFTIEWWGTTTELWTYFTHERPPLWIIPAWPVAALATDRLCHIFDSAIPKLPAKFCAVLYCIVVPAFVFGMIRFMLPSMAISSSRIVSAIMAVIFFTSRRPRRDLALFAMGSALGWFLEYWGTTRECWSYYTHETPPLITALAHGFASVAFGRVSSLGNNALELVLQRLPLTDNRSQQGL